MRHMYHTRKTRQFKLADTLAQKWLFDLPPEEATIIVSERRANKILFWYV